MPWSIQDYKDNPSENKQVNGIDISEGCPPAGINNGIRQVMADLAASGAKNPSLLLSVDQPNAIFVGSDGKLYIAYGPEVMQNPQGIRSNDPGNLLVIGTDGGLFVDPNIGETIPWDGVTDKPEAFTPSAHAATHLPGGSDPITYTNIPTGIIVNWKGTAATIPSGWVLCDGTKGTPDLRDKFVMGAGGTYTPGSTGGSATVTVGGATQQPLSISQAPAHAHFFPIAFSVSTQPQTGQTLCAQAGYGTPSGAVALATTSAGSGSISHTHGFSISNSTIPPFYALCFIMKL